MSEFAIFIIFITCLSLLALAATKIDSSWPWR